VAIEIHDVRMSFIWVETWLDLLTEPDPAQMPLAFLGRSYTYEPEFERLLRDVQARVEPGLSLPWINFDHQGFWNSYFEHKSPNSGRECWKRLVPLRGKLPAEKPDWLPGRFLVESFLYPHGAALVVTATCEGQFSLEGAVLMARRVRKTGQFPAGWLGSRRRKVGLKTLAGQALDRLRVTAMGPAAPGPRSSDPFSVVTIVRGEGMDPEVPIEPGDEIHRALEAVTTWSNNWQYDPLPDLEEVDIDTLRTESDIIYARKRGRAIWFPGLIASPDKGIHTLACLHRNQVFASLTVESLVGLVVETAKCLNQGRPLPPAQQQCARHAAGILGRLYGGTNTYRSWSPITQIDENGLAPVINRLRRFFNMEDLW
jgi:hypothetical protein